MNWLKNLLEPSNPAKSLVAYPKIPPRSQLPPNQSSRRFPNLRPHYLRNTVNETHDRNPPGRTGSTRPPGRLTVAITGCKSLSAHGGRNHRLASARVRSEEHTSELQSRFDLVCRLLLE